MSGADGDTPRGGGATLITGGAGFIGTNLALRLLSAGRKVILYDNLSRRGVQRNAEHLRRAHGARLDLRVADIRDRRSLQDAAAEADEIFHFAAQVAVTTSLEDPETDYEINAGGTVALLEAVRQQRRPVPLIFTSTNEVYGGLPDVALQLDGRRYRPVDAEFAVHGIPESRPLSFCSPYGCSKGAADQYVLDYAASFGVPTCVFRMSCIYGPHQQGNADQGWLAHFVRAAAAGDVITIYGDGGQVRDALHAQDLVDALLLARAGIGTLSGRAFNIGGGPANTVSLLEMLELLAELNGGRPRALHGDWRVGDQRWYVSDTRAFRAATGWSPRIGVREGVAGLHRWILEEMRSGPGARTGAAPAEVVRT